MGNPEMPTDAAGRQPGPVPEGAPQEEGTAEGAPPSSGASPTGHPAASPDAAQGSQPSPAEEEPAGDQAAADDSSAPAREDPAATAVASDKDLPNSPSALKILVKRYESERNEYLQQLQRVKAEFDNYRKRMLRQQTEHLERAAEALVEKLLPVLDNFEAAVAHDQGFDQVQAALLATLEKEGLERIHPHEKPFDPTEADAVAHEAGDDGPVVAEVLRPGYRWKGRVLRPAMVRVRG